jgi:anti-sigma factor RsiW
MNGRADPHVLTGSYTLDALSEPERKDFERHLRRCRSCEAEVRGLRETAARLALANALRPPPGMQERVLAASDRTRQLLSRRPATAGRSWPRRSSAGASGP